MLSRDDAQTYLTFIYAVLAPYTNYADLFYTKHQQSIDRSAAILRSIFDLKPKKLYRGILLDPAEVHGYVLTPISTIRYLSFSESSTVAESFADIEDSISTFVKSRSPHYRGYVIEHTPVPSEVLFHYSWVERLGLYKLNLVHLNRELVKHQCEVVLRQMNHRFKLHPMTTHRVEH